MRQYVGARYMPKFLGLWNNTQDYEALSVVENGTGTSYVSNKPVPAGTPLTNSNYWVVYGTQSGAVLHLQEQVDNLKAIAFNVLEADADNTGNDDCSAIIASLVSNFNCLYFPEGTYKIDTPITIDRNVSIIGDGATIKFTGWGAFKFESTSKNKVIGLNFESTKDFG